MKITFSHLSTWCLGLLLLILSTTLSSFSSVPVADVRDDNPPTKKTAQTQRQKRLQKRYNRLYKRFDSTTNTKKRHLLQKKIRKIERQQDGNPNPVLGIVGMVLGILAALLFFISISAMIRALQLRVTALDLAGPFLLGGLVAAVAGLILSIMAVTKHKNNPEQYGGKAFGIVGIIISSVALGLVVIVGFWLLFFTNV